MNNYTVYKHTSPSGKVYIGITSQPVKRRWRGGSAYRNNAHFYAAIRKYGWDSFAHEILMTGLAFDQACAAEIALIAKYQSTDPEKGYNVSKGGDRTTIGRKFTLSDRQRISQALKGKRKGIPHTDVHRARISEGLTGHTVSTVTRDKLREALSDRFQTETARKRQKENTPRAADHHRATAVRCTNTGAVYATIQEAADAHGVHRANISAVCRGLQKTAGGFRWEYVKENKSHENH